MSERKMIYLDDALDILDDLQSGYENGFNIYADSRKQMLDLPSAQPETHEKRTETHACDFISRQDAINAINHELRCGAVIDQCGLETAHDLIEDLPSALPERKKGEWIPCSERLPKDTDPVNITWVNHKPESYYANIKDKPFTATGCYCDGKWYWYSVTCQDYLDEYRYCSVDAMDEEIEVLAWMPLPEPFREGESE